ncbi:hypothetical protein Tco_0484152 [Tanacetum coccineum]
MESVKKSIDERAQLKREYERRVNKRLMQTQESKVDSNADIRLVNDQVPFAEKSNEAKVKHDFDVIETINIELEHKVAKLLKENETLKKHYKDLYDSIKVTRTKTIEQTTSFIAKNDEFKAQLQEKGFTIAALKNKLRKLKGNSVDTKFAKPSILGKPILQPPRNQSVVRQPNAFKSERPNFSKPQFASQVDVNNVLSKPVTPHYLPKVQENVVATPHHVIAPGSSRNSQEESYGSHNMAHNHYLEESRKKIQERIRNLKSSVMHTTSLQINTNGRKQKPRSNNQTSMSLLVPKSSGVTSNSMPLVDHSRNSSSFSDSKYFVCSTCQKCVFNANHDVCLTKFLKEVNSRFKSSAVHEKPNTPRSCLKWKPMGRIFKIAGLSSGPEPQLMTPRTINSGLVQNILSLTPDIPPTKIEWDSLFQPMFDEYFKPPPNVDHPVPEVPTLVPAALTSSPTSTIVDQDAPSTKPSSEETTLQGVIPSNLHHLNQSFDTLTKLTKKHPLENVIGDPSRSVSTRSQLQEHAIWCYFDANDNPIPFGGKWSG